MKEISIYDSNNKELNKLQIDFSIQKKDVTSAAYSCAVKALLLNWRQGTVACKGRSDVKFTNKKPWRQKGTGRARAGSARSPLWRSGGVTFGPQPRTRKLNINKKQIKSVLNNLFHNVLESEKLFCLDFNLKQDKPNTKSAFGALKGMGVKDKKIILFLPFEDEVNLASFRNISNIKIFCFDQPNVFDLSNGDCWVFLKKDEKLFKDMVSSWN